MEQILEKYIEKIIARCNYVITRLILEYENMDSEDENQEDIKKLIANIMELSYKLKLIEVYNNTSLEEGLSLYEEIRNMLNYHGLRNDEILHNSYERTGVSDGMTDDLNWLLCMDLEILDLEDFLD